MISHWVLAQCRRNEVAGDEFRPLMDKLIKCMLTICPRFSPDHWACLIVHCKAVSAHTFPVAFHIPLLQVCGKPAHVLVVGQDRMGLGTKEVVVPEPYECKEYR